MNKKLKGLKKAEKITETAIDVFNSVTVSPIPKTNFTKADDQTPPIPNKKK